jgi:hypothetical protein
MRSAGSRCSCSHACRLRIPTSTCAHGLESGHCQHLQRGLRFSLVLHQKVAQRRISRCKLAIRGRQSADHLPASRYPRVPRCDGTYRPRFATDSETTAALPVLFTSAAGHSHWSWAPAGRGRSFRRSAEHHLPVGSAPSVCARTAYFRSMACATVAASTDFRIPQFSVTYIVNQQFSVYTVHVNKGYLRIPKRAEPSQ